MLPRPSSLVLPLSLAAAATLFAGCDEKPSAGPATSAPPVSTFAVPSSSAPAPAASPGATGTAAPAALVTLAHALDEAYGAHDAKKVAALYAPEAMVHFYGVADDRGTDAIAASAHGLLTAFPDAKRTTGRIWAKDARTAVVEWLFTGTNEGTDAALSIGAPTHKKVGVMAASVLAVDGSGKVVEERRYLDVPTLVGQLLPPDPKNAVRPVLTALPSGTAAVSSTGAPAEAATIDAEKRWIDAFGGHRVDVAMKLIGPGFASDDYATPATIDSKGLRALMLADQIEASDLTGNVLTSFAAGDVGVFELAFHASAAAGGHGPKKPFEVHELQVNEFRDGLMTRSWSWSNGLELAKQIGLPVPSVPSVAPTASAR